MFILGVRVAISQGMMLLMSFSGEGVKEVMDEIRKDSMIVGVEEARFWQVHYGLCMANLKIRVRDGNENALKELRERIGFLVKSRLGGGYGKGGVKWEVTSMFTVDK